MFKLASYLTNGPILTRINIDRLSATKDLLNTNAIKTAFKLQQYLEKNTHDSLFVEQRDLTLEIDIETIIEVIAELTLVGERLLSTPDANTQRQKIKEIIEYWVDTLELILERIEIKLPQIH